MPSLKKNIFYSVLLVVANYVFPFLTYPYVSRVLGVVNIGSCNFVDSIINYFILFSTLGIGTLGVREIAAHKSERESLNKVFSNLFLVNLLLTLLMLIVLIVVSLSVPSLSGHKDLLLLGSFKLVFNCFLIEWLFQGLEAFKLISLRSICVKLLYVASVFVFVKQKDDVWIYYLLSCLVVAANALVNTFASRSRVKLVFDGLDLRSTFKSTLTLGLYNILTSMYTTFNITFLGFAAGDTEVGYYTTATKIYGIIISLFTAFTAVMIPKMSSIIAEGDLSRFKSYYYKAVDLLISFSLPVIVWMIIMAQDIVALISGPGYEGAITPMIIISPLIFVIGYEQILVLQTLLPLGKDSVMLKNSVIGALIAIFLNIIIVPRLLAVGSACVWAACELTILVLSQIAVSKEIGVYFPYKNTTQNFLAHLPLAALLFLCSQIGSGVIIRVGLSAISVAVYVFFYQLLAKKRNIISMLTKNNRI